MDRLNLSYEFAIEFLIRRKTIYTDRSVRLTLRDCFSLRSWPLTTEVVYLALARVIASVTCNLDGKPRWDFENSPVV